MIELQSCKFVKIIIWLGVVGHCEKVLILGHHYAMWDHWRHSIEYGNSSHHSKHLLSCHIHRWIHYNSLFLICCLESQLILASLFGSLLIKLFYFWAKAGLIYEISLKMILYWLIIILLLLRHFLIMLLFSIFIVFWLV